MADSERQETGGEQVKVKIDYLIKATAYAMIGREQGDGWQPYPMRIIMQTHATADSLFYALWPGNVVARVSKGTLVSVTLKYWQQCRATAGHRLTPSDAKMAIDYFEAFAPSFEEQIEPVLFTSDIGYCHHRLPFDPREGLTPAFDELMERTSNAEALKAWVGSLFDRDSERQQYLWIYGDGMNGKSSLARFLQNIFEDGATSAQPPGRGGDRFWSAQFLGKRLAILPDCNDYSFVNSGLFKSHTGDDFISIEEKNKGVYCTLPTWKFLILSNQKPSIEGEASAVRRAIYCEMAPIVGQRLAANAYQRLLRAEAPAFIHQCMETYKRLAPDGGAIETDAAITQELVNAAEERWAYIANSHLCLYAEGTLDDRNFNEMPFVTRHYMRGIQKRENLSAGQYQSFLNYLKRTHGVKIHNIRIRDQGRDVYIKCATRGGAHYTEEITNGGAEFSATLPATLPATEPTTVSYLHNKKKDVLKK